MIQMGNVQLNMNNHKEEHIQTVNNFAEHVDQLKKETLWKIKDCEDIIKTRIPEQKFNDTIEALDKKI